MNNQFSSGRALVVGVGAYQELKSLGSTPVYDAQDVAKLLQSATHCGYPSKNVQVLIDASADKVAIVAGLKKLASDAQIDETVVVYFSGHGAQRLSGTDAGTYLCPPEFERGRPRDTGIEAEELTNLLQSIPAERLLVVIDACHSGAAALIKDAEEDGTKWAFGGPGLEKLAQGKGRVIIAASEADEYSWILATYRNSLFTHYLLQGLQGGVDDRSDGLIRVLDLFHYVADQVRRAKQAQNPVLTTRTQDNFPIALRKGGRLKSEEGAGTADEPASMISAADLEDVLTSLYPQGPLDNELWSRAGGDVASLKLGMTGRAAWHAALRVLSMGGGGEVISTASLLREASRDFANNPIVKQLQARSRA